MKRHINLRSLLIAAGIVAPTAFVHSPAGAVVVNPAAGPGACAARAIEAVVFAGNKEQRDRLIDKSLTHDQFLSTVKDLHEKKDAYTYLETVGTTAPPVGNNDFLPVLSNEQHRRIIIRIFDANDVHIKFKDAVQSITAWHRGGKSKDVTVQADSIIELGLDDFDSPTQKSQLYIEVTFQQPGGDGPCKYPSVSFYMRASNPWTWDHGLFGLPLEISVASAIIDFSVDGNPTINVAPLGLLAGPRWYWDEQKYLGFGSAIHWAVKPGATASGQTGADRLGQITWGGFINIAGYFYLEAAYLTSFISKTDNGGVLMLGAAPEFIKLLGGGK